MPIPSSIEISHNVFMSIEDINGVKKISNGKAFNESFITSERLNGQDHKL